MQKIFCFGSEHFPGDEIAKALAKKIKIYKNFKFVLAESPHEILGETGEIWILDVVKNCKDVSIIQNPENLEIAPSLTCHDLDLGFFLKLLHESGKIQNIKIIALPFGENNLEQLEKEVLELLEKN
ncbi:hypothetical protein KAI58_00360 [Candidatus Gracilibacteria bacterium]|nr:hypothetical protein [Candidatus Gracilibacteria bacterium]